MSSDADIAAQRLLGELAELSLGAARDLSAALHDTDDTAQMIGLAEAYAKVGRCLRMSIALAARLRRGEALAPGDRDSRDLEERPETERDESVFIEERPERLDDRENLFDRLPSGDLDTQIATVARALASATRALPGASDRYRTRCRTLVAATRGLDPRLEGVPPDEAWPPTEASPAVGVAVTANRSRGPPH